MKRAVSILAIVFVFCFAVSAQVSVPRESQRQEIAQTVGDTKISLIYHRPNVKGRKIWDGLVPYGKVWRAGANEATLFEFSKDVTINGKPLPAGKYSFHIIPAASEWTLIFNKDAGQWGSFQYNEKDDAVRVTSGVQKSDFHEALTYSFNDPKPSEVNVVVSWENVAVPFTVGIGDIHGRVIAQFRDAIKARKPEEAGPLNQAANYVATFKQKDSYPEAMGWVDTSIKMKETYSNLSAKARLLKEQGKTPEAIATAEKALAVGRSSTPPANVNALNALQDTVNGWKANK
jgi:hypothetical protein